MQYRQLGNRINNMSYSPMNKILVIPIVLYVVSVLVSLFSPIYVYVAPIFFGVFLCLVMAIRQFSKAKKTDEYQQNTQLILYSGIALAIAPIFAGIFTVMVQ